MNGTFTLRRLNTNNELGGGASCKFYYVFPSFCGSAAAWLTLGVSGPDSGGNYTYSLGLSRPTGYLFATWVSYSTTCGGASVFSRTSGFEPTCAWEFTPPWTATGSDIRAVTTCCGCCCTFFSGGVERACGNCIYGRTDLGPGSPCYHKCITDSRLTPTLTLEHGGTTENLTSHPTQCTQWYNFGSPAPFQSSAILLDNMFTFFYVRSTSPLCIYTASGVPCINGQTFTWNVTAPGTGCPATLTGTISW